MTIVKAASAAPAMAAKAQPESLRFGGSVETDPEWMTLSVSRGCPQLAQNLSDSLSAAPQLVQKDMSVQR
ncbi:MAG: hypothetical protein R3F31_10045 [Verrucomicrobiales bacterium]